MSVYLPGTLPKLIWNIDICVHMYACGRLIFMSFHAKKLILCIFNLFYSEWNFTHLFIVLLRFKIVLFLF